MATATITFNLAQSDFEGIVDIAGSGIGYWATNLVVDNTGKGGQYIRYSVTDLEDYTEYTLTLKSVEQAILDLHIAPTLNDYYQGAIRQLVIHNDASDVGSDIADAIIQQACFGEVIYG